MINNHLYLQGYFFSHYLSRFRVPNEFPTTPQNHTAPNSFFSRCINLGHARKEAYLLLCALVETKQLSKNSQTVWKLYQTPTCSATQESIDLLSSCFHYCNVPEDYSSDHLIKMQYPFRHKLLEWLLPDHGQYENSNVLKDSTNISPMKLSYVIIQLMLKNRIKTYSSEEQHSTDNLDVESLYLETSFDSSLIHSVDSLKRIDEEIHFSQIQSLMTAVETLISRDVQYILENITNEVNI